MGSLPSNPAALVNLRVEIHNTGFNKTNIKPTGMMENHVHYALR